MMTIRRCVCFLLLGIILSLGMPFSLQASDTNSQSSRPLRSVINFGEDLTRPLGRFDVRLKYQDKGDGSNALQNTYRIDQPFLLSSGWQIATRADVPMISNNTKGPDNREGHWGLGLGDVLTQVALATPEHRTFRYAAGFRVTWPSATQRQFGSGQYLLSPGAAISYAPSFLSDGSALKFTWREDFGVGEDAGKKAIRKSVLSPGISYAMPLQCYVMLSPDIKINWADSGKWFVPFNLSAGKKFGQKMIVSLEWNQAMVKQSRDYDWDLEVRAGYFF